MYAVRSDHSVVDENGKRVSPCQSAYDPDFLAYQQWANEGGELTPLPAEQDQTIQEQSLLRGQEAQEPDMRVQIAELQAAIVELQRQFAAIASPG